MTRRDVVLAAIQFRDPPYVPWGLDFTAVPTEKLVRHFGTQDLLTATRNHIVTFRPPTRRFASMGEGKHRDVYGSVWDRSIDKDIGVQCQLALPEPTLKGFTWPRCEGMVEETRQFLAPYKDLAVRLSFGFAMFERAWGLRGMENILMDMVERPEFAHELFDAICEHDMEILDWAAQFKPDIIHFGDDWGQQQGLIMGPRFWREYIKPRMARLYARAHELGALVSIHCCGDVDELFDDLVEIGVNVFNPFQPEVMDIVALKKQYHGRLAFHGGMSIQHVMPFGTPQDVRVETRRLLTEIGRGGGYIFSPAHHVPADVPLENLLAMMGVLWEQGGKS